MLRWHYHIYTLGTYLVPTYLGTYLRGKGGNMNKYPWILAEVLDKLMASNSVSRYIDGRFRKNPWCFVHLF